MATLNENITRIEEAKVAIKNAIVGKGVAVEDTALLDTYADKINEIPTGGSCKLQEKETTINGTVVPDAGFDGLSKVTVNVPQTGGGKLIMREHPEMKLGNSDWTAIPDFIDLDGCEDYSHMFGSNTKLLKGPSFDSSKGSDFSGLYNYCTEMESIEPIDLSKAYYTGSIFRECNKLKTIPQLDFSYTSSLQSAFYNCYSLVSLPKLNVSNCNNFTGMFGGVYFNQLTDLGGFEGIGLSLDLSKLKALNHTSAVNVINNLGVPKDVETFGTPIITFSKHLETEITSAEKQVATDKGWKIIFS